MFRANVDRVRRGVERQLGRFLIAIGAEPRRLTSAGVHIRSHALGVIRQVAPAKRARNRVLRRRERQDGHDGLHVDDHGHARGQPDARPQPAPAAFSPLRRRQQARSPGCTRAPASSARHAGEARCT